MKTNSSEVLEKQRMKRDFLFESDSVPKYFPSDIKMEEIVKNHGWPKEIWYKGTDNNLSGLFIYDDDIYWINLNNDELRKISEEQINMKSYEELRKRIHRI